MPLTIHEDTVPLRVDETGTVRIGQTRVILELVIDAFRDGATPEQIVQDYDTLNLADVYAVIGYYLRHRDEVDAYLAERAAAAGELRKKIEERQGSQAGLRERLLRRLAEKQATRDEPHLVWAQHR
jgi:uncharacterized protein (DUF433 family)